MNDEGSKSIALVQEPYLRTDGSLVKVPNYFSYGSKDARACIWLPFGTQYLAIPQLTNRDISTVQIESKPNYILSSVYLDITHKGDEILANLNKLADFIHSTRQKLILGVDSNAHSPLWGSNSTNKRGEILEEWILTNGFFVANVGSDPTFNGATGKSCVDITIVSENIQIKKWCLRPEAQFTDHIPINFEIPKTMSKVIQSRSFANANWYQFRQTLHKLDRVPRHDLWSVDRLNAAVDQFEEKIITALDVVAPLRRVKIRLNERKPWSADLAFAHQDYCKLKSRDRTDPDQQNQYQAAKRLFRRLHKQHQTDCFNEFTSELVETKQISKLVKNKLDIKPPIGMLDVNGVTTTNGDEVLDALFDRHFPGSTKVKPEAPPNKMVALTKANLKKVAFITPQRVRDSLKSFGQGKAAGDHFKPVVLQNLDDDTIEDLVLIYKVSLLLGIIPNSWKKSRVVFIPKSGKPAGDPKSLRPITLNSFLLKGMEKILMWEMEAQGLPSLHEKQFAFKTGTSIDEALSVAVDKIEQGVLSNQYTLGIFLDISGAFDNIEINACVEGATACGLPQLMIKWLHSLLVGREVTAKINSCSQTRFLVKGTPQGGVWSPKLWNMAINFLLSQINTGPVTGIGFADDMLVLVSGPDPNTLVDLAQPVLDLLQVNARNVGLSFNEQKTEVILFSRKRPNMTRIKQIKMNGQSIPFTSQTRYLGLILDKRLSFLPHIKEKIAKTKRCLHVMHSFTKKKWGPSPRILRLAWLTIARPKLTYGAHVWRHKITSKQQLGRLTKVHRLALTMLAPVHRSAPTAGLELIWQSQPLDLTLEQVALKTYMRIYSKIQPVCNNGNGHLSILYNLLSSYDLADLVKLSDRLNTKNLDRHYLVRDFKHFKMNASEPPGVIQVYTDGSLINDRAGCGVFIDFGNRELSGLEHLGKCASVFQAEILAIDRAADVLMNSSNQHIVFKSDSQAAIRALTNKTVKSSLVKECAQKLNKLCSTNKVELQWIKAHVGLFPNEKADRLAKHGAKFTVDGCEPWLPVPHKSLEQRLNFLIKSKWQHFWSNHPECRQTKDALPSVWSGTLKHFYTYTRETAGQAIQFITGHGNFKRHQCLRGETDDPTCRICLEEDDETPRHLLMDCPGTQWLRRKICGKFSLRKFPRIDVTLRFATSDLVASILRNLL